MSWDTIILRYRILMWALIVMTLCNLSLTVAAAFNGDWFWLTVGVVLTLWTAYTSLDSYREIKRCVFNKGYYGE